MHCIDRLDVMVAYSCNLACRGCISISDRPRDGVEPLEKIVEQINRWKTSVSARFTVIFGGEPCLHPKLIEICQHVRTAWPNTTIRLITNGYLLDNFDQEAWFNLGSFEIQVSVHRKDHEHVINKKIKNILLARRPWVTTVHKANIGHKQIQWQHGSVALYKSIFKDFVVPYKSHGSEIMPWHSDPVESHKICGAPATPVLYKGKLYKCPAVANAMDINKQNWLDYEATDIHGNLTQFVNTIGLPEPVCAQCPSRSQALIIDHFDANNVIIKQTSID